MDKVASLFQSAQDCAVVKESYADTLINNLKRRKLRAEPDLQTVNAAFNAALNASEKNPGATNILELVSKAGQ